ncbi:alpha/beta fold hydrolase [Nocardioides bizhenqiangii]|uniref:Alpha/beta hydrolase n=1 Tax=Nocardioides bizhenqiangii TaxID=3095076 RepID=A0ABZ0ZVP1_9ACTN|nr:alpha/beta hydrolase [Nocardioides sp. HM61]WQQ28390.1 alpha/beta hydrolase [Nocardioides sp. HM61]
MNPEQLLEINGVELCVQTFGDPTDPAILLIHGASASMLWWEDELCGRLADGGRFVIRFDNRDTGRSTHWPAGEPGYAFSDMVADAVGVLDALGVETAHVVGRSMAGGTALALAVDHPARVETVTFVTTTTGELEMGQVAFPPPPDYDDVQQVVDHVVAAVAAYAGGSPHFDPEAARALAERDVARGKSAASTMLNHYLIDFDAPRNGSFRDVAVPTLVVHGEIDPAFPLSHGEALRDAVPGARLLVLPATGHDVPPPVWDLFVPALLEHTS